MVSLVPQVQPCPSKHKTQPQSFFERSKQCAFLMVGFMITASKIHAYKLVNIPDILGRALIRRFFSLIVNES